MTGADINGVDRSAIRRWFAERTTTFRHSLLSRSKTPAIASSREKTEIMDGRSWVLVVLFSGVSIAMATSTSVAQSTVYAPRMQPEIADKYIVRPTPNSRAEQTPVIAPVVVEPIVSAQASRQKAPFVTRRGPMLSAAAAKQDLAAKAAMASSMAAAQSRSMAAPVIGWVDVPLPEPVGGRKTAFVPAALPAMPTPTSEISQLKTLIVPSADKLVTTTRTVTTIRATPVVAEPTSSPAASVSWSPQRQTIVTREPSPAPGIETALAAPVNEVRLTSAGSLDELNDLTFPEIEVVTAQPQPTKPASVIRQVAESVIAVHLPAPDSVIPEPAQLPTAIISQPVPTPAQPKTDSLLSTLEHEVTQMQAVRQQLRRAVDSMPSQPRETSAETSARQSQHLQTLVTQVVSTLKPEQRPRVGAARVIDLNASENMLVLGQSLYDKGLYKDAEVAFRAARAQAATSADRTLATYLLATTLRKSDDWSGATRYYEEVAHQTQDTTLADLARWQLATANIRRQ